LLRAPNSEALFTQVAIDDSLEVRVQLGGSRPFGERTNPGESRTNDLANVVGEPDSGGTRERAPAPIQEFIEGNRLLFDAPFSDRQWAHAQRDYASGTRVNLCLGGGTAGEQELPSSAVGVDCAPNSIPYLWQPLPLVDQNRLVCGLDNSLTPDPDNLRGVGIVHSHYGFGAPLGRCSFADTLRALESYRREIRHELVELSVDDSSRVGHTQHPTFQFVTTSTKQTLQIAPL
jgi:hypothetical protein